eukprot:TRINITY_DN588_c0_g1_i2.p1 TRINITY_DN588_c0_g1~~TRINITY_DN588_c0_g1_i2.p1  ORF type:complete len:280 (+),score=49.13 TRINITY_DN588_c0_g1_i2:40-879(+)
MSQEANNLRQHLLNLMNQKDELEKQIAALTEALPSSVSPVPRPGRQNDLVDEEGFPRADIDVYDVRMVRHHLAKLQFDHRAKMSEIENTMAAYHQLLRASRDEDVKRDDSVVTPVPAPTPVPVPTPAPLPIIIRPLEVASSTAPQPELVPFYLVDQVFEDSPAALAGLKTGDQVLRFGSLTRSNFTPTAMQDVVRNSIGQPLALLVSRLAPPRSSPSSSTSSTSSLQPPSEEEEEEEEEKGERERAEGEGVRQRRQIVLRLIPQSWRGRGLLGCHLTPM